MTIIDKIVFSQNAPAKNTLWARPSEKGTELLIFNKGKWGIVGAYKEDVTTIVAPVNTTDATLPITTLTTEIGKYYRIDVPIETLAVTLPAMDTVTSVKKVGIYFTAGTTPAVTITSADSKDVYYQDGYELEAGKTYKVNALFDGSAWIVDVLTIKVPFFAKLTLTNGEVVELQGSEELTSAMTSSYKSTLVSAEIGTLCTSIGKDAFHRCSGLTSIDIPNSVTDICNGAFAYCTSLTSIVIPDSVTNIVNDAFNSCSSLTSVTIGNSVTRIGNWAFGGCSGLTSIVSNAMTAPTITDSTFLNVKRGGTLTVPSGSTGYDVWMGTRDSYLGYYNWTKVEQ